MILLPAYAFVALLGFVAFAGAAIYCGLGALARHLG